MKNGIISAVALALALFLFFAAELFIPLRLGNQSIEFEIKKGMTYRQAVEALAQKGMVRNRWTFLVLGKLTGIDHRIKAGYYPLWGSMKPVEIFNAIRMGKILEYEITIVPGDSLREIAGKLAAKNIIETDEFLKVCNDRDFLYSLDIDAPSLEGYLFPDTYKFPKGLEVKDMLTVMTERLREKYDDDMLLRTYELGLSEKEALTMASIIEKEAVVDDERPIIAAVYYNRLRKHMPLQADPTAVYGVKPSNEKITRRDLTRKTLYNTYIIKGLPPGPIASPGLKSIKAALYPANVPYLYFVSCNDGTHKFSVTLSSHNEAVRIYRDRKKREEG